LTSGKETTFLTIFSTCRLGAKTSTPSQGEDANICPRGYYCEEGTDESESCPAGTFSNTSGKAKVFGEGWSKNVSLYSDECLLFIVCFIICTCIVILFFVVFHRLVKSSLEKKSEIHTSTKYANAPQNP
jgi:hypothetical protein